MPGKTATEETETGSGGEGRGIRRLTRPVFAHIVTDPESYAGLRTINVGDSATKRSAKEVQLTARRLARGYPGTQHTAVVVEEESGETVAFATIRRNPMMERFVPEVDITAFGRDVDYRGVRLRDGSTSCGEIAVIAALDAIALAFDGLPMPQVWARVLPDNDASHAIFDRLGFLRYEALRHPTTRADVILKEDQNVRIMHSVTSLPPWPLDPDVYVPPDTPNAPFLIPLDHTKRFPDPPALARNSPCWCGSGKKYKKCCM